jgi:hypothetical protein
LNIKDRIKELWQNRFKHGVNFTGAHGHFNVYGNGAVGAGLAFGVIESAGTGHWPLALFKFSVVTGERHSWQLMLCGLCMGTSWLHVTDEQGTVAAPDKNVFYCITSAINHVNQSIGDII